MTEPNLRQEMDPQAMVTGFWTGVFDTDDLSFDATPFHAFLTEEGGAIHGEMIEPNGFSPDPISELFSSVEGWRDEEEIEFVKTYENALGAGFSVRFEGVVEAQKQRIKGVWSVLESEAMGGGLSFSGPFVMNRVAACIATSAEAAANNRRSSD